MFESKSMIVIFNGRQRAIASTTLTYEELALWSGYTPGDNPTVTYRRGPLPKPEGTLVAGEQIAIQTGMIFNVVITGNA